jgi:hypothetical protein
MIGSNALVAHPGTVEREAVVAEASKISERWRDGESIRMPGTAYIAVATKPNRS